MKYSGTIKDILFYSGLLKLSANFRNGKIVSILRYHSVVEPENNYYVSPDIAIHPELFETHVKYFSKNFNVISLDTVAQCIEQGTPFPDRAVVFTFDDGYRDNFTAYQIMKKYNVTGTFYIASSCIENHEILWLFEIIYLVSQTNIDSISINVNNNIISCPLISKSARNIAIRKITKLIKSNTLDTREFIRSQLREQITDVKDLDEKASKVMLTWKQVKQMSDDNMTIGGHTTTHLNLPNADPEDARQEINQCKKDITTHTGKETQHFSYPNGGNYDYYNADIMEMVKNAGFTTATTSNNGTADLKSNPYELYRIRVTPHLSEVVYQICAE